VCGSPHPAAPTSRVVRVGTFPTPGTRTPAVIDNVISHLDSQRDRNVQRMMDFLRIPSISTDPQRKPDMHRCAEWVHRMFEECGIRSEIVPTDGHPAVLADSGPAEGGPTLLVYGHYDVQPTGDPALWHSPPFEPTIRDGAVFARGSADDKGQVLTHVLAAEAWMKAARKLPIRVKFLIEGEEEVGSSHLPGLIEKHAARLACDYVALSDTAKLDEKTPAITYGTKGLIYKEITVTGPRQDMHSGAFGGTLENPGNAMARIIDTLKDPATHRVTIPGFYDDVRPLTEDERAKMRALPFEEEKYREMMGTPALVGETGFSTLERRWARPTLDVNGLFGGFTGEGASTIIPAKMSAKVSMRIVPDQDPERISRAFDDAVRAAAPKGVRVEVRTHGLCAAYVCPLDLPAMQAATRALESGFGKKPVYIREGGSLPILPLFKKVLGADSVMLGFSVPNCNLHGPNEFFGLSDFHNGAKTSAWFMHYLAQG
jgi:acetylornithine deacetylase/succinyl-diaminopimelate desuccinylase-like protein